MSYVKNLSISFFFTALSYLIGPIILILIVKPLSVAEYGLYNLINIIILISVTIVDLGFSRFNLKEIPGAGPERQYTVFKTTLFMQALVGLASAAGALLLLSLFSSMNLVYLFAASYFLFYLFNSESLRFMGLTKRFDQKALISFMEEGLWLLPLLVVIYYSQVSISSIFLFRFGTSLLVCLIAFLFVLDKKAFSAAKIDQATLSAAFRFGLPLILVDLGLYMLEVGDRYIIQFYHGNEAVGHYSFVYTLTRIIFTLGALIMYIMQPYTAEVFNQNLKSNGNELRTRFTQYNGLTLKYTVIIVLAGTIYLLFNFSDLVMLIGKKEYLLTFQTAVLLSGFPILMTLAYYFQFFLILHNKNKAITRSYLIATLLNVGLNFILVKYLYIEGAAIATVISYAVILFINFRDVEAKKGLIDISRNDMLKITALISAFAVSNYAGSYLDIHIILKTLVLAAVFLFFSFALRVMNREELETIRQIV